MPNREVFWLVTCEHATNYVPEAFAPCFKGAEFVLASHRGYDIGAREAAYQLAQGLHANLFVGEVTRLLVELNRSDDTPQLWSEFSADLSAKQKAHLMARYYYLHRDTVEQYIHRAIKLGLRVVHLSVHSFTPVLNGAKREVDLGLLFDPDRSFERKLAEIWLLPLARALPDLNVRANEPYHGCDDGFTTYLRTRFEEHQYAGMEIEMKNTLAESLPNLGATLATVFQAECAR